MTTSLAPGYLQTWNVDSDPDSSYTYVQGGTLFVTDLAININTLEVFQCTNNINGSATWDRLVMQNNFASVGAAAGWQINVPRAYTFPSLALNTARRPTLTNDVQVLAICNLTSALTGTATMQLQVSSDGTTYNTIAQESLSGLVTTNARTLFAIVPAGSYYKIVNSSGTATISSISELIM